MKKWKLVTMLATVILLAKGSGAQDADEIYTEGYARAHIAYTDFMKLGISPVEYAKCMKVGNFLEPGKTPKIVNFNGEEFRDDGKGHDQKGGDGILTSIKITPYEKGAVIIGVGAYQMLPNNYFVCDENFSHQSSSPAINGFTLKCKFVWVSCYSWPEQIRGLCLQVSWPFNGYFSVTECEVGYTFK